MGLNLKTHPDVFIPRPETEQFVKKVIAGLGSKYNKDQNIQMLEVGCGSGAMSLAILNALPNVQVKAFDLCDISTNLAKENAKLLNLHNRIDIYTHAMTENEYVPKEIRDHKFDVIISNPPYVKDDEFALLQPEVTQ